jgi:hypothetical protein
LKKEIMEAAKTYWLRYFPLEEMPDLASIIAEGYRNNLLTDEQALSSMKIVEKSIEDWVKQNNNFNRKYTKRGSTGKRK